MLVLGSGPTAVPLISRIRDRGLRSIVCGNRWDDPGLHLADEVLHVDYSDASAVLECTSRMTVLAVVPTCNDTSYKTASHVALQHRTSGLDLPEVADTLHSKLGFQSVAERLNIPSPNYTHLDAADLDFSHPYIVKPDGLHSGLGVAKVLSDEELRRAVSHATGLSPVGSAVVQRFIEGTHHSYSAFVKNTVVVADFITDEWTAPGEFWISRSLAPSSLSTQLVSELRTMIERLSSDLDLADGLIHAQFVSDSERIWLLEVMRRCPGDFFPEHFRLSFGFDFWDAYLDGFLPSDAVLCPPEASRQSLRVVRPADHPRTQMRGWTPIASFPERGALSSDQAQQRYLGRTADYYLPA